MSNDLRQALQDLANTGADHAGPATLLAGRATNRVTARRRRRRVTISAVTLAGMAAVGTGAAAAISYFSDDPVSTFPDRLLPTVQEPAAPTGLFCDAEVGDITASTTPFVLRSAMAGPNADLPMVTSLDAGNILMLTITNATTEELSYSNTERAGIYVVKDGRVVAVPVQPGELPDPTGEAPLTLTIGAEDSRGLGIDRVVTCDGGDLPGGDYQAYSSIEITVPDGEHSGTYDVVGGPWPIILQRPDGSLVNPVTLPDMDPAATFPQCGAPIDTTKKSRPFSLGLGVEGPITTGEQESTEVDITTTNTTTDHLRGTAETATLALVRDGVVVGRVDPVTTSEEAVVDLDPSASLTTSPQLAYTVCTPPTSNLNWLPPGEYSLWGHQSFTITERTPVRADGSLGAPEVVSEQLEAFNEVATIVIPEGGQPIFPNEPDLTPIPDDGQPDLPEGD